MERKCVDCGKLFHLSDGEINFFKSKGMELPKRCKECREARNPKKASARPNPEYRSGTSQNSLPQNNGSSLIYKILAAIAVIGVLIKGGMTLSRIETPEKAIEPAPYTVTTEAEIQTDPEETAAPETTAETETKKKKKTEAETEAPAALTTRADEYIMYTFRNADRLNEHFDKHGREMGFSTAEDYERRACDIINDPNTLFKIEAEDGDGVYFVESTNEFVVLSTDGFIRTYYICDGKEYFDRQ